MLLAIFRFSVAIFALFLIGLGLLLTPSPIPFGIVIIAIGLALLVTSAPGFVRAMRKRWRWLDARMHWLEDRLPEFMAKRLRASDYDHDADDECEAEREQA